MSGSIPHRSISTTRVYGDYSTSASEGYLSCLSSSYFRCPDKTRRLDGDGVRRPLVHHGEAGGWNEEGMVPFPFFLL